MIEGEGLDIENDMDFLAALCGIISLSGFFKNIAQAMIDAKYPEPLVDEKDEGEKDEEKKKEKDKDKDKKKKEKEKEKDKKKNKSDLPDIEIADHNP